MSIDIVVAEKGTLKQVDSLYFIFDPEFKVGGMFSMVLSVKGLKAKDCVSYRNKVVEKIKKIFTKYDVKQLFAYNSSFDKNLLPELSTYLWFDIIE